MALRRFGGDSPRPSSRTCWRRRGYGPPCTGARDFESSPPGPRRVRTIDRTIVHAPLERVFRIAAGVERWPEFLPHYRRVEILERDSAGCLVDMAAWRPFGVFRYPTRWVSRMEIDDRRHTVRYRHVRGITRGMDVEWTLRSGPRGVEIMI